MTTTVMRESIIGDAWIHEMCQLNPVKRVIDPATWQPNGNITTGPVRLSFTDSVFEKKPAMKKITPGASARLVHQVTCLFTPWSVLDVLYEEYNRICASDFQNTWNGHSYNVDNPFRNQGEKAHQYTGYTPGLYFINPSSEYKPAVVDVRGNPIVDQSKVYPGVWAIVAVNSYASGKGTPRQGPRFGLQSIMIIADDKNLAGSAPDPKTTFAGVNVKPPANAIPAGFGAAPPMQPAPIGAGALNQPSLPPPPSYAAPAAPVGGLTPEQRRAFGLP